MSRWLEKLIVAGLLAVVVFTVIAHGAVEPWAIAVFEISILVILVLWLIKCLTDKRIKLRIPAPFWPLAAFLVYGLIQSVVRTGPDGNISSLSIDVEATRNTVVILSIIIISFLIAANFFVAENRIQIFVKFLTVFGFVLALLSLIQYFIGFGTDLFWRSPPDGASTWLHGPFLNHSHFAGYMELIIPLPFALVITNAVKQTRVMYAFAVVIMTIAVVFSVSRGGFVSLAISIFYILAAGILYIRRKNKPAARDSNASIRRSIFQRSLFRNLAVAVIVIIGIFVVLGGIGIDPIVSRLPDNNLISVGDNQETFESSRGWIWKNSYAIFRSNKLFGTGMGTFENALQRYGDSTAPDSNGKLFVWTKAHNEYLQILAETGLIGGALAFWFVATLLYGMWRGFFIRNRFHAAVAFGCSGAIISLLIHSLFDYNLQLPSTGLLFLIIAAVSENLRAGQRASNKR